MVRFFPVMFASGRVSFNRFIVTATDLLVVYALYLSFEGEIHALVGIIFAATLVAFYIRVGFLRYFKPVKVHELLKVNVFYDNGYINVFLIVKSRKPDDPLEQFTIPLKVKTAFGGVYHRYVLYVYMSLSNSLVMYARKLRFQG
ncbi:hypothetical protein ACI0X9_003261 [Cronobacter turicensis]